MTSPCLDCVYDRRCFRILKCWVMMLGRPCHQSRKRRAEKTVGVQPEQATLEEQP